MKSFFKSRMVRFLVIEVVLALLAIAGYLYYQEYQRNNKRAYEPFATTSEEIGHLNKIETAAIMEGTHENDLMVAHSDGSKIFAKGGLNYVVAGSGVDEIYYSLCSTKIIDGKVNVIEGFDHTQDKIKIFCGHHEIKPEQIKVSYGKVNNKKVTYIDVKGQHTDTAIVLLGHIHINAEDIILNERWVPVLHAPGM